MSGYHPAPEEDVVVTSRVRLARNFVDIPFAPLMKKDYAEETVRRADVAVNSMNQSGTFQLLRISELNQNERKRLVEHHLISYDLLKFSGFSAALISTGETVSIMVNEEDHLRIQGLLPGMQIERAANLAYSADDWLGTRYPYAFDHQLGYLTSCPTNTGTGMRASVMLHLPALSLTKQIGNIVQTVGKLGMTVRGIYGEGSEALGNLYQLSNQVTLGRSEEDIIKSLNGTTAQIINTERFTRKKLWEQDRIGVEDRILRSLAIAQSSRLIDIDEFMTRYSDIRVACGLGLIKLPTTDFDQLMMDLQPASLNVKAAAELNSRDQKAYRAKLLRETLRELLESAESTEA